MDADSACVMLKKMCYLTDRPSFCFWQSVASFPSDQTCSLGRLPLHWHAYTALTGFNLLFTVRGLLLCIGSAMLQITARCFIVQWAASVVIHLLCWLSIYIWRLYRIYPKFNALISVITHSVTTSFENPAGTVKETLVTAYKGGIEKCNMLMFKCLCSFF